MRNTKIVGKFRLLNTERRPDGYNDYLVIKRYQADLQVGNEIYKNGAMKCVIEYKGTRRSKGFKGEVAHHDLERWINETIGFVF